MPIGNSCADGKLKGKRCNWRPASFVSDEKSPRILRLHVMSRHSSGHSSTSISFVETLPDRPVSEHPNLVTERGLAMIEQSLEAARREYGKAQAAGDRGALARAACDLRYWNARRATAHVHVPVRDRTSCNWDTLHHRPR